MTRPLRFGICIDQNLGWEKTVERWRRFEELGFDSIWDCDHWVQPSRPLSDIIPRPAPPPEAYARSRAV